MKGVFVTATDTGVGKTYIASLLAESLSKNFRVGVFKPFLSGSLSDAKKLKKAARSNLSLKEINPVFLKYPLAPYPASVIEKKKISFSEISAAYKKVRSRCEFIIAEGAGGVYVPVTKKYHIIDLIKKLRLPVILVARPGLGTINHILLTLKALKEYKIDVLAVILNSFSGRNIAEKTNPSVLRELIRPPLFLVKRNQKTLGEDILSTVLSYGGHSNKCSKSSGSI